MTIPRELVVLLEEDSVSDWLQIHVMNDNSNEPVMGEYIFKGDTIVFQPLIPFTRSLYYEVTYRGNTVAKIGIPDPNPSRAPEVVAIYPAHDSVPENLLKVHVRFSKPMSEANPLSFVYLLRHPNDTVDEAFLDLRPALWDRKGTMLTLWLDPGRIKRDLQPNQRSGPPLLESESYSLIISPGWPAKDGTVLKREVTKNLVARHRDTDSPDPSQWKHVAPAEGTFDPLKLDFNEALDFVVLTEAIDIVGPDGTIIEAQVVTNGDQTGVSFIPSSAWQRGRYQIRIESRLEDLAGNNLNRLFDRDISVDGKERDEKFYVLEFSIP